MSFFHRFPTGARTVTAAVSRTASAFCWRRHGPSAPFGRSGCLWRCGFLTDWVEGGWDIEESIELARLLKPEGVDLVVAARGDVPDAKISRARVIRCRLPSASPGGGDRDGGGRLNYRTNARGRDHPQWPRGYGVAGAGVSARTVLAAPGGARLGHKDAVSGPVQYGRAW